jgi:hypothetical protein
MGQRRTAIVPNVTWGRAIASIKRATGTEAMMAAAFGGKNQQ